VCTTKERERKKDGREGEREGEGPTSKAMGGEGKGGVVS